MPTSPWGGHIRPPFLLQTADNARDFFKRKIDFLTKQMEKIQPALQEKHAMKQGMDMLVFSGRPGSGALPTAGTHLFLTARTAPGQLPSLCACSLPCSCDGNDEPEDPAANGHGGFTGCSNQGIAFGIGSPGPARCTLTVAFCSLTSRVLKPPTKQLGPKSSWRHREASALCAGGCYVRAVS